MKRVIALVMAVLMLGVLFVGCSQQTVDPQDDGQGEVNTPLISGPEDLAGKKIGVQEGTTGDIYVTDEIEGSQVFRFKSGVTAAMDLKNGMIDAIVLDSLPAQRIVEQNPDLMILDEALTVEEYAIAVRKEDTELLANINAAIAAMKADGTYDALRAMYMPDDGEEVVPNVLTFEEMPEKLVMGTNSAFEPFEYKNDEGAIVGFDIEMANYIALAMGKQLVISDMNFDALIAALQTKAIDMIVAGMTATEERRESVNFSDPYFNSTQVIIVKK